MQRINRCASLPSDLERLLPPEVTEAVQASGAPTVEEVRLHANRFCTVKSQGITYHTHLSLTPTRMRDVLQALCSGSLYTYEESIRKGYLTPCNGVRVGVCGHAATERGEIIGVCNVSTLVIRIPHRVTVDASLLSGKLLSSDNGGSGMLIYAPPGVGKTTLLRAITQECATPPNARHTVVVDTREELCYGLEDEHLWVSILSAYPRRAGIEIAVRSLGAELIVCDEIGNDDEVNAILSASNCGVPLLASVHGTSIRQLFTRDLFKKLHASGVFRYYVALERRQNQLCFSVTTREQADRLLREGRENE